ncbi:Mll5186 protein [plant metagenome]|uniref:Mll5186 protein n=1 Tax=plant metagenome TaxID=1297885 RepID=A0A484RCU7_9ZZZZ
MQNTQTSISSSPYGHGGLESSRSAVSWGAVVAGAVIAAAVSALLLTGGSGFGFLSVSPWRGEGASGTTLAVGSIAWLFATQVIAYGIAGYVTGRLRTKWTDVNNDEAYFRDTAHGFLVWALSALVGLILVGSALSSAVSGAAKVGGAVAGAGASAVTAAAGQAAQGEGEGLSLDYFTDALFRADDPAATGAPGDTRQEASRILGRSLSTGQLSEADRAYLVKLIAREAGVDEASAQQRLKQVEDQARQVAQEAEQKAREAADTARKAAAAFSFWAFVSMLVGAFVASFFATLGGRARDR